jgi:hypothetical protein
VGGRRICSFFILLTCESTIELKLVEQQLPSWFGEAETLPNTP